MCITLILGHANCSSHPQNGHSKSRSCRGRPQLHLSSAYLLPDILLSRLAQLVENLPILDLLMRRRHCSKRSNSARSSMGTVNFMVGGRQGGGKCLG